MQTDWLQNRITYIKGLKKPSEHQELLVLLHDKPNRSKKEEQQLAVLVKAEVAAERAASARASASKLLTVRKDEERKARNHRLILQGLLIDFAGIESWDRAELLGALMSLAKTPSVTAEQRAEWKRLGATLLAEKEPASRKE